MRSVIDERGRMMTPQQLSSIVRNFWSGRLLLHGLTEPGAADMFGRDNSEFAGVPVKVITEGNVAALVSDCPVSLELPQWLSWLRKLPKLPTPETPPFLSAISSMVPLLPAAAGTVFANEQALRKMLAGRAAEIEAFVADNCGYVECELTALFNNAVLQDDTAGLAPLSLLRAQNDAERDLVAQSVAQAIAGRKAAFIARLNRFLAEETSAMVPLDQDSTGTFRSRALIPRSDRLAFRRSLEAIAADAGNSARLTIGPYLPPLHFRCMEVRGADETRVGEARMALGVDETADRKAIRNAYHRALERVHPRRDAPDHQTRASQLTAQFRLLELVAEGQIKAARGALSAIRFDAEALQNTWLLRFHTNDVAERAA